MNVITQKKKQEAEEEREKEAQLAMDAEFSLEEFLGIKGGEKRLYVPRPSMKPSPSQELKKNLGIKTEKIDYTTEVTDAKFQLKADCAIGMREIFFICDRTKSGSISREFEPLLLTFLDHFVSSFLFSHNPEVEHVFLLRIAIST